MREGLTLCVGSHASNRVRNKLPISLILLKEIDSRETIVKDFPIDSWVELVDIPSKKYLGCGSVTSIQETTLRNISYQDLEENLFGITDKKELYRFFQSTVSKIWKNKKLSLSDDIFIIKISPNSYSLKELNKSVKEKTNEQKGTDSITSGSNSVSRK